MITLTVNFEESGDTGMHERSAERLGDLRPFLEQTGQYVLSSMFGRLVERLNMGEDVVRTGMLTGSLNPKSPGKDQVFDLTEASVEVGSNLPYAAQVNFGGTITPVKGRALAIPLTKKLKLSGQSPAKVDPTREKLVFVPYEKAGGLIGFLFEKAKKGDRKKRASFMLVSQVHQEGKHYAVIDADDERAIEELFDAHLAE